MNTIEERAKAIRNEDIRKYEDLAFKASGTFEFGYMVGATEQKAIDHSEEHLNWIIKQYHLWSYEMCHCDNNECCTFKEWIDKAME